MYKRNNLFRLLVRIESQLNVLSLGLSLHSNDSIAGNLDVNYLSLC